MFKPTKAKTFKEYFDLLPEERKKPMKFLHDFIRKTAPKLKPNFIYNMPGYGSAKYKNYQKKIVEWPIISIASQKNYISVYVCAVTDNMYVAEKFKDDLGKVNVGKSCVRIKKLDDLNLKTFEKVVKLAVKSPGLIGAERIEER